MQQMQAIRIRHGFAGPARLPPVRTVSLQILPLLPNVLHPAGATTSDPFPIGSTRTWVLTSTYLRAFEIVGDLFAALRFSHNLQTRLTSRELSS